MGKLTDEELDGLQEDVNNENPDQPIRRRVARLIAELRARRAADLTDEEREALASLRSTIEITGAYGSKANRALAVLDRLLGKETP